jgi:hypothetical protein
MSEFDIDWTPTSRGLQAVRGGKILDVVHYRKNPDIWTGLIDDMECGLRDADEEKVKQALVERVSQKERK